MIKQPWTAIFSVLIILYYGSIIINVLDGDKSKPIKSNINQPIQNELPVELNNQIQKPMYLMTEANNQYNYELNPDNNANYKNPKRFTYNRHQNQFNYQDCMTKPIPQPNYMVLITSYSKKYHRIGCSYLQGQYTSIDRMSAINRGYSACTVCNP